MTQADTLTRLEARIDKRPGGCWLWFGSLVTSGLAQAKIDGRKTLVHRWLWEQQHGPLQPGEALYSSCGHADCVNPEHRQLVPVSRIQAPRAGNLREFVDPDATVCSAGHELTDDNVVRAPGTQLRRCRACRGDRLAGIRKRGAERRRQEREQHDE